MSRWIPALIVGLVLVCSACESAPTESGSYRTIEHGSPIVSDTLTYREDLRIGSLDGERSFSQVAGVRADQSDRIYILESLDQQVHVFDRDGRFLRSLGGVGDGPGETRAASGLLVSPAGEVWIWDPRGGRYTVFASDGDLIATHARPPVGVIYPLTGGFSKAGRLVEWVSEWPTHRSDMAPVTTNYRPLLFDSDLTSVETLAPVTYDREVSRDGRRPVPFSRGLVVYQGLGDDVWFAHNKRYTLYSRTLQGDTMLAVSVDMDPPPVTSSDLNQFGEQMSGLPSNMRVEEADLPTEKPLIRRIFGDDRGRLYVIVDDGEAELGTLMDVFTTSAGDYLGRTVLPVPAQLIPAPWAIGRDIYAVTLDELDVPYVVRLRQN